MSEESDDKEPRGETGHKGIRDRQEREEREREEREREKPDLEAFLLQSSCICNQDFSGDGKICKAINPCEKVWNMDLKQLFGCVITQHARTPTHTHQCTNMLGGLTPSFCTYIRPGSQ